mmetsp:Transcript_9036/g.23640  ORF Transcript_9036/g.23640 Transcript_9036/m.23640 type:complete len:134 (+) Transcript_9036:2475-2876(+)
MGTCSGCRSWRPEREAPPTRRFNVRRRVLHLRFHQRSRLPPWETMQARQQKFHRRPRRDPFRPSWAKGHWHMKQWSRQLRPRPQQQVPHQRPSTPQFAMTPPNDASSLLVATAEPHPEADGTIDWELLSAARV